MSNGTAALGAGIRRNSQKGWVVQKFGGTSVGKFAGNIAEDIVRYVPQGRALGVQKEFLERGANEALFLGRV
jgi:hypothetical protein